MCVFLFFSYHSTYTFLVYHILLSKCCRNSTNQVIRSIHFGLNSITCVYTQFCFFLLLLRKSNSYNCLLWCITVVIITTTDTPQRIEFGKKLINFAVYCWNALTLNLLAMRRSIHAWIVVFIFMCITRK